MREARDYTGLTGYYAMDASLPPEQRLRAADASGTRTQCGEAGDDRVVDPMLGPSPARTRLRADRRGDHRGARRAIPAITAFIAAARGAVAGVRGRADAVRRHGQSLRGATRGIARALREAHGATRRAGRRRTRRLAQRLHAARVANGIGMLEAGMGFRRRSDWAEKLEQVPNGRVNAVQVRA